MTDTIENPLARKWRPNRGQMLKLVSVGLFAALGTFAVVQSIIGEKNTPTAVENEPAAEPASAQALAQGLLGDGAGPLEEQSASNSESVSAGPPPVIPAGFQAGSPAQETLQSSQAGDSSAPKLRELNLVGAERKSPADSGAQPNPAGTAIAVAKPSVPSLQPASFPAPGNRPAQLADSTAPKETAPKETEFKPAASEGTPRPAASPAAMSSAPPKFEAGAPAPFGQSPAAVEGGSKNDLRSPATGSLSDSAGSTSATHSTNDLLTKNSGASSSDSGPANGMSPPSGLSPTGFPEAAPNAGAVSPAANSLRTSSGEVAAAAAVPVGAGIGSNVPVVPGNGDKSPDKSPLPNQAASNFGTPPTTSLGSPQASLGSSPEGLERRAPATPPGVPGSAASAASSFSAPTTGANPPSSLAVPGSGSTPPFKFGDQSSASGSGPVNQAAPPGQGTGPSAPASFSGAGEVSRGAAPNAMNSNSPRPSTVPVSQTTNPLPPISVAPSASSPNAVPPSDRTNPQGAGNLPGALGSNPNPLGQNANLVRDGAIAAGALPASGGGVPGKAELEGEQVPALSIEKVAPREIQIDQPTDFRIIVKNVGRVVANEVRVTDTIPRGAQFVKAVPEAGRGAAGSLVWELGSLKPGEERSVVLTLQPKQTGEIGSVAQVTFAAPASMRVLVTKPQLAVEHTGPAKVTIGDRVPLAINVRNLGNGPAKEVILQEVVPPQLKFAEDFSELEYEIGTLAPGESRKVNLNLTAAQIGRFRNTLLVSGAGGLHAEHQIDMEVVAPLLELSSEGPSRRYLKRNATHVFSVRNSGTAIATNLDLVTKLAKGVRFVSANNQGQYDPGSHAVYWSLDRLNVGQGASVQLTTTPEEPGEQALEFIATADLNQKANFRQPLLVEDLLELFFEIDDVEDVIEVGSETRYRIRLINQGTVAATNLQLSFSAEQGIRPVSVDNRLAGDVRGQEVVFAPVAEIRPGQELVTYVTAIGAAPGEHRIVARLRSDQREMNVSKEESTRVYADR